MTDSSGSADRRLDHAEAGDGDSAVPTVTVVVPIYNEAEYRPGALPALMGELAEVDADIDVLLVENGSTDDTVEVAGRLMAGFDEVTMTRLPDANYGAAIRHGWEMATGRWVVVFDIDYFSGRFLADALAQGGAADVILASKRAAGSDDRRSPVRRYATWQLNALLRLMVGLKATDTHGMKVVGRPVLDAVLDEVVSVDDLFDTELVLRAERAGFRVIELPVVVTEMRESKSTIWRRVPRTLLGVWRLRSKL